MFTSPFRGGRIRSRSVVFLAFIAISPQLFAQSNQTGERLEEATLSNVVAYSLKNQPTIQQSIIDQRITESQIKSRLADWYPQINFNYNIQHNFVVQTNIIGGNPVKLGVDNTSAAQFALSQNIFNRDVLLANKTKEDVLRQATQLTARTKIDVVTNVSKAYYDVLATQQQINVSEGDIARLERSLKDAYTQYSAGVSDKIDYKRATIALNNTKAALKTYKEILKAKTEYLKTLMGYPVEESLSFKYDTLQMERESLLDTVQTADYQSRIEYQLFDTQKKLQEANLRYNKWSYLPSIVFNGAYNFNFLDNNLSDLYSINRPNSFVNVTLALPLFQGGKRKANIAQAEWQLKRLDWDLTSLKLNVNAEYNQAMAAYKGSLSTYLALKENMELAKEVYDVVNLQYKSGIKTYLEVVTSETDLRQARINYYNALYQVLANKIDVQKALGQLNY
jgi:outer membrane protein